MAPLEHLLKQTRNIYAIGRNYTAHARELGNAVPTQPVIFSKQTACLCHGDTVVFPAALEPIHYEAEVVLRLADNLKTGQLRGQQNPSAFISHLGLGIDFTARTLQSGLKAKGLPWERAKSFQNSAYIAALKPANDMLNQPLKFRLLHNGTPAQQGDTALMLFDYAAILKAINRFLPLNTGDLIFTGTPAGVGPVAKGDRLRLQSARPAIDQMITVRIED